MFREWKVEVETPDDAYYYFVHTCGATELIQEGDRLSSFIAFADQHECEGKNE